MRLTVGLVEGPALAGNGDFTGLCSQYVGRLKPGDVFYGYARVPSPTFAPPVDPATPLILIGPGTGIAPLRGFLEERAWQHAHGTEVGRSQVFIGCRHPEHDWYYRDEMQVWEQSGIATAHTAFSAVPDHPARYVQDAITAASDTVWQALEDGAYVYVCGDGRRTAPAVREAPAVMHRDRTGSDGDTTEQWLAQLDADGRYQLGTALITPNLRGSRIQKTDRHGHHARRTLPPGHQEVPRGRNWRRRHQARSRWFHQRTRLERENALVS